MTGSIPKTLLSIGLLLVTAIGSAQVSIRAQYIFEGQPRSETAGPIKVEISNNGPDLNGALTFEKSENQINYPIDLPRGSTKAITLYDGNLYGGDTVHLNTNRGRLKTELPPLTFVNAQNNILHISDTSAEFAFVRNERVNSKDQGNSSSLFAPLSVTPENTPDRQIGFRSISAIILGEGAERLSDAQVAAVKSFVLSGGTLLFMGGAGSPVLADARWTNLLPITQATVSNNGSLPDLGAFTNRIGTPTPGTTTVPFENSIRGYYRSYGLGLVSYLSVNLLDKPLDTYPARPAIVSKILRATRSQRVQGFLNSSSGWQIQDQSQMALARPTTPTSPGSSSWTFGRGNSENPFTLKLPETSKVAWTLIIYFIFVIPVNFLVLRKMKKLEWAWFTSPVISLTFAAILFQSASGLYSAKLSTNTTGVIIGQSGVSENTFMGNSQIFFPNAGFYDLKLKGIDEIATNSPESFARIQNPSSSFSPVDNGEIQIPNVVPSNLDFQQIYYWQISAGLTPIRVKVRKASSQLAEYEILNSTGKAIREAQITICGGRATIKEILPGTPIKGTIQLSNQDKDTTSLQQITSNEQSAFLTGTILGIRPGPQLGTEINPDKGIGLVIAGEWTK